MLLCVVVIVFYNYIAFNKGHTIINDNIFNNNFLQSMKDEKSSSLQILESINNKKPKFNLEKAANKAIHAEEVE